MFYILQSLSFPPCKGFTLFHETPLIWLREAGIDTSPKNEGKRKPFWEKGNPSQYPFIRKGKRLPESCRKPVVYMGWFIGGADLILSTYAYIESMSTDMSMSPAPPSNRWWERSCKQWTTFRMGMDASHKSATRAIFTKKGNPARSQIPFSYCDGAEGGTRTPTGFPATLMQ